MTNINCIKKSNGDRVLSVEGIPNFSVVVNKAGAVRLNDAYNTYEKLTSAEKGYLSKAIKICKRER